MGAAKPAITPEIIQRGVHMLRESGLLSDSKLLSSEMAPTPSSDPVYSVVQEILETAILQC